MVTCPRCKHRFPLEQASQNAFELFHVVRDAYAKATGHNNVYAKDELCVMYGVSMEVGDDFLSKLPKWPGVFCELWGRKFFRKSTLAMSKEEMNELIGKSYEAVYAAGGSLPAR